MAASGSLAATGGAATGGVRGTPDELGCAGGVLLCATEPLACSNEGGC